MNQFAAVILAAGRSSRMGSAKQLLTYQGNTFLEQTTRTAGKVFGDNLYVVLGANADRILQTVPAIRSYSVVNDNWQQGMGSSIAFGLSKALIAMPGLSAVLFMTIDQPYVNADHLQEMIRLYAGSGKAIIASQYRDTAGIPALFRNDFFPSLLKLESDKGAKDLIKKHTEEVELLPLPFGEIDIDTPEQYDQLRGPDNS